MARRQSGLTQAALAERARTSQAAISAYESGRRSPSVDTLCRILDAPGFEVRMRLAAPWRNLSPAYDPRSGEGARLAGGRFNLPNSFPVLYLCLSRACTIAELRRLGERQAIGVDNLLPRHLYRYTVQLERVLDLSDEEVRTDAGVVLALNPSWPRCGVRSITSALDDWAPQITPSSVELR